MYCFTYGFFYYVAHTADFNCMYLLELVQYQITRSYQCPPYRYSANTGWLNERIFTCLVACEVAHWLEALAALIEDPSSVPSTHVVAHRTSMTPVRGDLSLGLHKHQVHMLCSSRQNSDRHKINLIFKRFLIMCQKLFFLTIFWTQEVQSLYYHRGSLAYWQAHHETTMALSRVFLSESPSQWELLSYLLEIRERMRKDWGGKKRKKAEWEGGRTQ